MNSASLEKPSDNTVGEKKGQQWENWNPKNTRSHSESSNGCGRKRAILRPLLEFSKEKDPEGH
jgi:hypothetical protein